MWFEKMKIHNRITITNLFTTIIRTNDTNYPGRLKYSWERGLVRREGVALSQFFNLKKKRNFYLKCQGKFVTIWNII